MAYPFFLTKLLIRTGVARWLPSIRRLSDGGTAFLHYYGDDVLCAPHGDLREMGEFLEIHGPDAVNLALAEPRFDLVPSASTKLPAERRGWPPLCGLPELRETVAAKLRDNQNLSVSPSEEILITSGVASAFRRARLHWVPTWMESGRIRFHMEPLVQAMRRAHLLVVNSPANPTGGIIAPEDLEQIAWWADRRDVLIFNDEVFERFIYEGASPSIGTLPRAWRRTLTAGSVSKGYALAAARVGWLAGHRHLIRPCTLTAILHAAWPPTLCQQIALTALRQGDEAFASIHKEFDSRRRYTYERLQAMGLKPVWPAGAFFVWLPIHELGLSGIVFARKLLQAKRVLVSPGEFFGPGGGGHVRISYAADDGRLREGLTRLAEFVRELRGPTSVAGRKAA